MTTVSEFSIKKKMVDIELKFFPYQFFGLKTDFYTRPSHREPYLAWNLENVMPIKLFGFIIMVLTPFPNKQMKDL